MLLLFACSSDPVTRLGGLPRHLTASVGTERVGIIHGDPESLAGWRLALEAMEPGDPDVRRRTGWAGQPTTPDAVGDWFRRADVSVLASTHTGLPFAQDFLVAGRHRLVINNGAAGLGNFADGTYGVVTRLSSDPRPRATACTASRSVPCAATRCRSYSIFPGGGLGSWRSGHPAALATAPTSRGLPLRREQAACGNVKLTGAIAPGLAADEGEPGRKG